MVLGGDYSRGYHDARSGKGYDDGFQLGVALMTLGLAGGARDHAESYREGYRDGKSDRK